jgi:hypothetical protein
VHHTSTGLILTQHKYMQDLLLRTNMENSKGVSYTMLPLKNYPYMMLIPYLQKMLQGIRLWLVPFNICHSHYHISLSMSTRCANFFLHQPQHTGQSSSIYCDISTLLLILDYVLQNLVPLYWVPFQMQIGLEIWMIIAARPTPSFLW